MAREKKWEERCRKGKKSAGITYKDILNSASNPPKNAVYPRTFIQPHSLIRAYLNIAFSSKVDTVNTGWKVFH